MITIDVVISHPLSASSIYYNPWYPTCVIYVPDGPQSPSFLWFTSWPVTLYFIPHTFLHQSLSSFCCTWLYHCNLFRCSTEIMSSNPSLSLNPLLGTLSCSLMPHPSDYSHLCLLKFHLIFLFICLGLTSMQHTT